MADRESGSEETERNVHDLAQSINKVRSRQANRDDVVVDLKHARLSRLEILCEDLVPVFEAVSDDNDQFEFAITQGETPRLWVDMTSFVRMAGDGREYEFVKDTRLGRTILGRTANVKQIGELVADYVAERVLERERMIEGEWFSMKQASTKAAEITEPTLFESPEPVASVPANLGHSNLKLFIWFAIGIIAGGGLLMASVWFGQFDKIVAWVSKLPF